MTTNRKLLKLSRFIKVLTKLIVAIVVMLGTTFILFYAWNRVSESFGVPCITIDQANRVILLIYVLASIIRMIDESIKGLLDSLYTKYKNN